jgi:hypothetical protein
MVSSDISSLQKLLRLSGTIQRDLVSTLADLSGFSKRRNLLEAQLRKAGHSISGIEQSIGRLLSIGLLTEKAVIGGSRIALTKEIWSEQPEIIEAVFKIAQVLGQDRRSDTQSNTVIREVKSRLANHVEKALSSKLYFGVANAALLSLSDWTIADGVVVRSTSGPTPATLFNQKPHNTIVDQAKAKPTIAKLKEPEDDFLPDGIAFLSFDVPSIVERLKQQLTGLEMSITATENFCRVSAKLPLGRQQQVFISLRHDPMRRKVFWLYTLCGPLSTNSNFLEQALAENNNDCGPMRVTVLKISGTPHLGCCASVSAETGWETELPQVVCLLSNLGDHLEEKFWKNDHH